MANSPLIQIIRAGNMWRVCVDGACLAFRTRYHAARDYANHLENQIKLGGAA